MSKHYEREDSDPLGPSIRGPFGESDEAAESIEQSKVGVTSSAAVYGLGKVGDVHAPRPMPLEGPLKEDSVHEHRNLYCLSYDRCLDLCVQEGWPGWTCRGCAYRMAGAPPEVATFAEARPRNPILG